MDENDTVSRKTIGTLNIDKLAKVKEFQNWHQASQAFAAAKQNSQHAKDKLRDYLRRKGAGLRDVENLDFIMNQDQKSLTIFETRERVRKARGGNSSNWNEKVKTILCYKERT